MVNTFRKHIEKFVGILSNAEIESIVSYFQYKTVKKKQILQEEDLICNTQYFVVEGCLRSYYIKDGGVEQTVDFAIENWWMTDYKAFGQQGNSGFYIQAVENSHVLSITKERFDRLLEKHPILEKYFRIISQRAYAAAQYRLKYLFEFSREELYFHFEERFPSFVQRIPQYLMASYLGFSPEYLSEIKKKRFS